MAATFEDVAAALQRRGVDATSDAWQIWVRDGKGIFEVGCAGDYWASDYFVSERALKRDEPAEEGFMTEVSSESDDVERIAAAIVRAIAAFKAEYDLT